MRSVIKVALLLFATQLWAAELPYFSVLSEDAGAWPEILSSIGLQRQPAGISRIFVARSGAAASVEWIARVDKGAILILEGESGLADMFGFKPSSDSVKVNSLVDVHRPGMPIVWERGLELPRFDVPKGATVFAKERWNAAPMIAGMRRGSGAVLWVATLPGEHGYERYPYLLAALCDLGLEPPFRSSRLWAFFDSSYRLRVDVDYFAARWRKSGIAALHVAAWHYFEPDAERDAYMENLIRACHRDGILVYAWLELPHVSDKFWNDHPEWREKTAGLQDAKLDWRKLINLTNQEAFRAVAGGVHRLVERFDWDGVNLAELYFESLEGIGNPARFTPMNDDVRALFRKEHGFDPIEIFANRSDDASRRLFLDFRAELARRMQADWMAELESARRKKPHLDLVLTHIDDRFDTGMRDALGADAARVLPMLDTHPFTFLIEDPATVWNLGPQRYHAIAEKYQALTPHGNRLAIDLNIVDRYQSVYPTKQQTGTELFELVHSASSNFARVALYFENSLLAPDLPLLPAAASTVTRLAKLGSKTVIDSVSGVGLPWRGGALVDGQPWPSADDETLWLPAGPHSIEPAPSGPHLRLIRLNGDLRAARVVDARTVEFSYESGARSIAVLDRRPSSVLVDGVAERLELAGPMTVLLPRGQHVVTIATE